MPTPDPVEEAKYWYSFDHGPVHYIAYSTELDYAAGSEQNTCALPTDHLTPASCILSLQPEASSIVQPDASYKLRSQGVIAAHLTRSLCRWIQADLKAVNRSITPWVNPTQLTLTPRL